MQRKKQTIFLMVISLICYSSCKENSYIENEMHGLWQVSTIEEFVTGEIIQGEGNLYFSFQRNMMILGYRNESKPIGTGLSGQYICEFDLMGDSIRMGDFRNRGNLESKVPLKNLHRFGIYDEYTTFAIERPNRSLLVLKSDKAHITMRKY